MNIPIKMDEKENVACVRRWKNVVGKRVSFKMCLALWQALTTNSFRDSGYGVGILQGVTRVVIAFIAIATNLVVASDSQFNGENNVNAIATSDTDTESDYQFDSIDKRFYRNLSANTSIVAALLPYASATNLTTGDSYNDSAENVTMLNFGSNLLFTTTMADTLNAIKSNDTIDLSSTASNVSSAMITESDVNFESTTLPMSDDQNNYWALSAIVLVIGTAAGNILVCLAIAWERRLQNVTNYFLMSLAITDLMVAMLVMPLGILILVKGEYFFFFSFCYYIVSFS